MCQQTEIKLDLVIYIPIVHEAIGLEIKETNGCLHDTFYGYIVLQIKITVYQTTLIQSLPNDKVWARTI